MLPGPQAGRYTLHFLSACLHYMFTLHVYSPCLHVNTACLHSLSTDHVNTPYQHSMSKLHVYMLTLHVYTPCLQTTLTIHINTPCLNFLSTCFHSMPHSTQKLNFEQIHFIFYTNKTRQGSTFDPRPSPCLLIHFK